MRFSLITLMCLMVFSVVAKNTNESHTSFPAEIPLKTQISEDLKINHKRSDHEVIVRYLQPESDEVLFVETFNQMTISNNELKLSLGQGQGKKNGFSETIKNNPELKLSIQLNDEQLYPTIGLLPAGHSIKSTLFSAGIKSGEDDKHWKGYTVEGSFSSVQTVILSKDRVQSQGDRVKTNPYQATMIGPVLSQPLASLPAAERQAPQSRVVNTIRHENLYDKDGKRFGTTTEKVVDALAQDGEFNSTQRGSNTPDLGVNFEALDNISGVAPPDIEGAVGPNHFVQMVNSVFRVYDKTGAPLSSPVNINTLWSGFGGRCESDNSGDPIVLYDEQADRFVLTQFAVAGAPESVCFAVSETPDPTGTFYLYQLQAQRFPDYYKVGVWPVASNNAYTLTTNSGFQGGYDVYALDRENMLAGLPARPAQFFQNYPNLLMPADNDGIAPPSDSPALLYTMRDGNEPYFNNPPSDSIDIYEFNIDWNTPANTSLTLVQSLTPPNGNLTDFNWTVCGFFQSNCLPQPGTGQLIDSGSWWPQQRFQYRNFGTYEVLVGTWTVEVDPAGDRAAPRWFELRRNIGDTDWSMYQEGTFSPDATHRFSPSIAMDASGNIGLGFSVTSSTEFPSIRYTVHDVNSTPLGSMESEKVMKQGTGSETGANRWGDYASMDVDPVDGCTFWFTSEYIETNGGFNWQTYVGTFRMPDCVSINLLSASDEIEVCDSDPNASYSLTLSNGFAGTTNMSVVDCPAGGTCGFTDDPVVFPDDNTDFEVSDLASVGVGTYPLTLTATDSVDSGVTASTAVELSVFEDITVAPNLLAPAENSYAASLAPMLSWDNASVATDFLIEVDDDNTFSSIDFDGMTQNSLLDITTSTLNQSTCYYWRVTPSNVCGPGIGSVVGSFYTGVVADSGNLMSADVPVAITTSGTPTITSELNVAGVGIFDDVDLVDLTIQHTWINDLSVELTSPEGTTVTLMNQSCDSEDNIDLTFDDEAAPGPWPCPPTDGGSYQPSNPLSAFDGEDADGLWVLTVNDNFNQDGGSLDTWGLKFTSTSDPGNQCVPTIDPTAVLDSFVVLEDVADNSLDVLFNDTDPDGGLINIDAITQGNNGGTVVNNGSDVSYTPAADFCGLESFSYTLNGGSVGTVEVDVTCVNDQPSMTVNPAVYVNLSDIGNPPAQNIACDFDLGPDDEDVSQVVAEMIVSVVNDSAGVLNSIDVDNTGALSYSFSGNSGVAEVTVSLQDDGGTADQGVDTSTAYTFLVNVQDYVFRNNFESVVCQ